MPFLFTDDQAEPFRSGIRDHFTQFASYHQIVIHKEAKKTVSVSLNEAEGEQFYGYDPNQENTHVTLTPVTGVYNAIVTYPGTPGQEELPNAGFIQQDINALMKVEEDAKDFINSRKTEKIELDGNTFLIEGTERMRNYLGLKYYTYALKDTN